ncbi:hypothetical protein Tco_0867793 [Tanacetum coccineum]
MTSNKDLFLSYKTIEGSNVVFGGNTKSKIVRNGTITHNSLTIHGITSESLLSRKVGLVSSYGGEVGDLHENTEDREILFLYCYAFSVSLLLTPLCCDDIHDVTPRVSALAGMSPPIRRKYHNSVAFATGCKRIKNSKRCNRKIQIPIAMWPCRVEEKMTLKEVDGQTVKEVETKIIAKDGTVTRIPGQFQGYETSEEEPVEQPRKHDLYGFVDHP